MAGFLPYAFARRARNTRKISKPLAGVSVADGHHEEAEPEGQHDDVQHGMLLVACLAMRLLRTAAADGLRWINTAARRQPDAWP